MSRYQILVDFYDLKQYQLTNSKNINDLVEALTELGDDPNNRIQFYEFAKEIMERDLG